MFLSDSSLINSAAILQNVYGVTDPVGVAQELVTFYGALYPGTTVKYVAVAKALQQIYPSLGIPPLANS